MVGSTRGWGEGGDDVYLVKTDEYGDTLWTRTYGGSKADVGRDVQQTADSGYIITGFTVSNDTIPTFWNDGFLIKTDANGDTLWTALFMGVEQEEGRSVRQCEDGGYIVCGIENTFGPGQLEIFLAKYNSNGKIEWAKEYGGSNPIADWGNSVEQTSDGGFIITGSSTSFGPASTNMYLIKTDSIGDTLWTRIFGGTVGGTGYSVKQCTDNGYIIVGLTVSFGAGGNDIYVVRTDANGDTLWTRTYGGTEFDWGYSAQQTSDGGFIICGSTNSFGVATRSAYLIKTDANGDTLWTRAYGQGWMNDGASVQQCADGGYIIGGSKGIFVAPPANYEMLLIKTDANGRTAGCLDYGTNTIVTNPPTIVARGALVFSGFFEGHFPFVVGNTETVDTTYCFDNGIGIIEEEEGENELTIYPNPTAGIFTVQGTVAVIQVYDLFGRLVLSTNKRQVDMSTYPAGIYMVRAGEAVRKLILH